MIKPNLFLVGAPKCGTTALYAYIREHPNVFMARKEIHYFSEDFPSYGKTKTLDQYKALFNGINKTHLVIGEASVWYLYSSVALKNIYKFNPDAKIIVMLRNPIDMVYSLHSQLRLSLIEDEKKFAKAWEMQDLRQVGKHIPPKCPEKAFLLYKKVGSFTFQLKRLYDIFPSEQVKVIIFDDFVKSTKKVYEEVIDFIEVVSDERIDFPIINENSVIRSEWLGHMAHHPPQTIMKSVNAVKNLCGIDSLGIIKYLKEINKKKTKRRSLDIELKEELVNSFRGEVQSLSNFLNRDLGHWLSI
ncbi:hypothetical protein C6A37_03995 [Desulfobacteraceae bacterium SEEP-SAG9]|nr:hypothetical protein C6A37_03995 [Desulfobacteraceae bacterium SEEP-SAG9]